MNIHVAIHYQIRDNHPLQRGSFKVDYMAFLEDPHQEAARVAYSFFKQINQQYGNDALIEKVIYNSEHDITDIVKELHKK